jgi:hypothetical protein
MLPEKSDLDVWIMLFDSFIGLCIVSASEEKILEEWRLFVGRVFLLRETLERNLSMAEVIKCNVLKRKSKSDSLHTMALLFVNCLCSII